MAAIAYSVVATLPDEATRTEYIAWLEEGHLSAVLAGGAQTAVIVRVTEPGAPPQMETRYVFPTRALFDRYIAETAPSLRAEGLRRFGPERGVSFVRRVGEIV